MILTLFLACLSIVLAVFLFFKIQEISKLKKQNEDLKNLLQKMQKFSKAGLKLIEDLKGDGDENFRTKG